MRLYEFEGTRIPNPLNGGKVSADAYEAMEIIDDIEADLIEELSYILPPTLTQSDRLRQIRQFIDQNLGKVTTVPIAKLIPFEPDYDKEHILRGVKSELADVYLLNGKYYINDGNHRVIAAHLKGEKLVKVNIFDTADITKEADRLWLKRTNAQ
jgi:hypothetical protein